MLLIFKNINKVLTTGVCVVVIVKLVVIREGRREF